MEPDAGRHKAPATPHPLHDLADFRRRLEVLDTLAELALDHRERHSREVAAVIDGIALLYSDFHQLFEGVAAWFRQSRPEVDLAVPDVRGHVLTIRELAARTLNVGLDLEEAGRYDIDLKEGDDLNVAHLEHLEAAVSRARGALTTIARDLLLSVGITPEHGGDDA